MTSFRLVRATEADLAFVMATECLEGYDAFIGRWDAERHRAALASGSCAYFIGYAGGEPAGFAILHDWDSAERVTLLKRIAVTHPGQGYGRGLLRAVARAVFQETEAHRLWLNVFPENQRARRVYEAFGFVMEGVARESAFSRGAHRDVAILSILRREWLALYSGEMPAGDMLAGDMPAGGGAGPAAVLA
jgi:RimJ/RimL family protein N-acetyltransferase